MPSPVTPNYHTPNLCFIRCTVISCSSPDGFNSFSASDSDDDGSILFSPQRRLGVVVRISSESDSSCSQRGHGSGGEEHEWDEGPEDMRPHVVVSGGRKRRSKSRYKKARTLAEDADGGSRSGVRKFVLCKHCGYMLRGHICAASSSDAPEQAAGKLNVLFCYDL